MIRLLGDWAPGSRTVERFDWGAIHLFNLEGPVIESDNSLTPSLKAGPSLGNYSLPEFSGPFYLASLANNHLMDFGRGGLLQSTKRVAEAGGMHAGAGSNLEEALRPVFFHDGGYRFGVLAVTETQFGTASHDRAGVAPISSALYSHINSISQECDFVIVSVHAGAEMHLWPSPRRQDFFRSIVDAGANIVWGHHAHIYQGWEEYGGGLILYGMGNFCVDPSVWKVAGMVSDGPLYSIAADLSVVDGELRWELIRLHIVDGKRGLRVEEVGTLGSFVDNRSEELRKQPLSNRPLLEGLWQEHAVEQYRNYYSSWLGGQSSDSAFSLMKFLRQTAGRVRRLLSPRRARLVKENSARLTYHLFACDTHSDLIATALGTELNEARDFRTSVSSAVYGSSQEIARG